MKDRKPTELNLLRHTTEKQTNKQTNTTPKHNAEKVVEERALCQRTEETARSPGTSTMRSLLGNQVVAVSKVGSSP